MSTAIEYWRQIASNYGIANTSTMTAMECLRAICDFAGMSSVADANYLELLRFYADRSA